MSKTPPSRGGSRPGAGRKPGTGNYGEPTEPVRVPVSLLPTVRALLRAAGKAPPEGTLMPAPAPVSVALPLYGAKVAAGLPAPVDDHLEDVLDLNEHLVRHPATTFLVRVRGDSMIGAGIHHGDLLVVDRSREAKDGTIIIAVVNGELTVKRLRLEAGRVWLMPENPDYVPIEIMEGMDLAIGGVVAHVVHSL